MTVARWPAIILGVLASSGLIGSALGCVIATGPQGNDGPPTTGTPATASLQPYTNLQYGLEMLLPADWRLDDHYFAASPRIDGADGFMQLIGTRRQTSETAQDVARRWTMHMLHPWGLQPVITPMQVDGHDAALVWPSDDQVLDHGLHYAAVFIVYGGLGDRVTWVGVDIGHVRQIIATAHFVNASPPSL